MKKLFCIILALSLCGCTQPETQTSSTSSSTQTEIRLVCSEDTDKIEELTKAFEGENPEIKITVITTDRDDDFALATKALLSGQHIPTLILSRAEHLNDLADCFADLSNEGWVNNALPNTLSEINREGEMIAMPAEIEGIGFVYDKDVFETANINPQNINSIERLKATAEHLSEKLTELKKDAVFSKPDEHTVKYLINI
ncbi:MAG: extracellular solute-binding protein, partial [Clostridia bacterium]|nr:extracellular solute-binding protein [Clostridia bacterium]